MRRGVTLYLKLAASAPDFLATYTADDTLPLSLFDAQARSPRARSPRYRAETRHAPWVTARPAAQTISALDQYTGERPDTLDLYQSSNHPFQKVLRDNDLDPSCGKFRVAAGFVFVACTHFGADELGTCLSLSVPLAKMQPIRPTQP